MLRIGYDLAAFERAVREVILEPRTKEDWLKEVDRRRKEARGETGEDASVAGAEHAEEKGEQEAAAAIGGAPNGDKKEQPVVVVNKEHLAYVVSAPRLAFKTQRINRLTECRSRPDSSRQQLKNLEIPDREAKAALRKHNNDLSQALLELTGPVQPVYRSGTEPSRLVKV